MSASRLTDREGNPPEADRTAPSARAAGPATEILRLQRSHGNRSVARSLSQRLARQPAATATPATPATPAPPVHSWAAETSNPNKALGKEIDELEKLTGDAFLQERETVAVRASRYGPNHDQDVLELEAIEFLAAQRGLAPLAYRDDYYSHDGDGMRRRNVRYLLEAGIRETGSLKEAAERIEHKSKAIESDIAAIEIEANAFGREFHAQAFAFAQLMLERGEKELLRTLRSYGLDPVWAGLGADEILHHQDPEDVAERFVGISEPWEADSYHDEDSKPRPARQKRLTLAADVRALKAQQQVVEDLRQPMAALVKSDWQRGEHITDQVAYDAARQRFEGAERKLKIMWARAEGRHPVLASFRSSKPQLKDVDLGALDQVGGEQGSKPQMKTMLTHLLPRLRDIRVLRWRLEHGYLKPLSLPPVVALTKAAMFVPEGSIRAGKVNDLVEAEEDKSISTYIAEGLLALIVMATLIPTGGASLGVAIGLASAALSATSAVEDWEAYKQHRMLNNTALDRAKALATEEPSLLPFAIDLISLGIDGLPLIKAFHGVVELRNLVRAREEIDNAAKLKAIREELNNLGAGAKNKDPHLGDRVLKDLQGAEHDANASAAGAPKPGSDHPKPPAKPPSVYGPEPPKPTPRPHPKPPAEPTKKYDPKRTEHPKPPKRPSAYEPRPPGQWVWTKPPNGKYATLKELSEAIDKPLQALTRAGENSEWSELMKLDWGKLIKWNPKYAELLENLKKVHAARRDPRRLKKLILKVYEEAGYERKTPQAWLEDHFGGSRGMPAILDTDLDPDAFREALRHDKPALDYAFEADNHGVYTHMFDEMLVEDVLGSRDAARQLRQDIANAKGPARMVGRADGTTYEKKFFSQIWDALFDSGDIGAINNPDSFGQILIKHLGFLGKAAK